MFKKSELSHKIHEPGHLDSPGGESVESRSKNAFLIIQKLYEDELGSSNLIKHAIVRQHLDIVQAQKLVPELREAGRSEDEIQQYQDSIITEEKLNYSDKLSELLDKYGIDEDMSRRVGKIQKALDAYGSGKSDEPDFSEGDLVLFQDFLNRLHLVRSELVSLGLEDEPPQPKELIRGIMREMMKSGNLLLSVLEGQYYQIPDSPSPELIAYNNYVKHAIKIQGIAEKDIERMKLIRVLAERGEQYPAPDEDHDLDSGDYYFAISFFEKFLKVKSFLEERKYPDGEFKKRNGDED